MEIKRLTVDHYDELLDMLNYTFGHKYGRPMDFIAEQPKMWVRDNEHMNRHLAIFEDGKLVSVTGVYPLPTRIGGIPCLLATTGNVATLPEYEGRGYFNAIFTEVMNELDRIGADAGRLGGDRQRYARFGYEPGGATYKFTLSAVNRVKYFKQNECSVSFERIERGHIDALRFCHALSKTAHIYVERSTADDYRDVYLAMRTKSCVPYLALKDGQPIGYLCAYADSSYPNGRGIGELRAIATSDYVDILCAWQKTVGADITFGLTAHQNELLRIFYDACDFTVVSPSRFKIVNFQKITDALMKLLASTQQIMEGECVLGIKDYGNIRLYAKKGEAGCEKTDAAPALTLDRRAATRLLIGTLPTNAIATVPAILKAWLPLPMSWGTLDFV